MLGRPKSAAGRFWAELRRRRVIGATIAYLVVAWLIIEVASTVFPALHLPPWTVTLVAALAILAFPAVIVLAWIYDLRTGPAGPALKRTSENPDTARPAELPPLDNDANSVAVLPFESHAGAPDRAYLAQSMATELHLAFSRIPRLRVASRVSSFAYAGIRDDVRRIGRSLNARFVVSGSVTSIGEQLRVTVAIDDAGAGTQIWTRSYDGTHDDVLELLQRIAQDTASAFGGVQLEQDMRRARSLPTENLDAWTRVQRARAYLLEPTQASMAEAVGLLEEAIDLDPQYALAEAALASVLGDRALNGLAEDLDRDAARALELADRAAEIAPGDAFVLKLAGGAAAWFGDTANALRRLRRSVQLAPFDLGAWGYLGWPLAATGNDADLDELHTIMSRMLESAPEHPGASYWLLHRSVAFTCAGRRDDAADYAARSVERNPRFAMAWFQYCNALGAQADGAQARKAFERAVRVGCLRDGTVAKLDEVLRRLCADDTWRQRRTQGMRDALPEQFDTD